MFFVSKNTLRELDHEQHLVLNQASIEKEKLERDKYKYKLLFKQKQIEANELQQKILDQIRNYDEQQVKLRGKNRAEVGNSYLRLGSFFLKYSFILGTSINTLSTHSIS